MPLEVMLYLPVSLAIAFALAAFSEPEPKPMLVRGLKTWAFLLVGGALFGLFVVIAQRPEMVV